MHAAFIFDCRIIRNTKTDTCRVFCLNPICCHSRKKLISHVHLVLEQKPNYDKVRKAVWTRQFGINAAGKCCACDVPIDFTNFHCAHDVAKAVGGAYSVDNLFASCSGCNTGTSTCKFSDVIAATRARLNKNQLPDRMDSNMMIKEL